MKFQKLETFEKHLKEAYPQHLSSVYIILTTNEEQWKKILSNSLGLFKHDYDEKRCPSLNDVFSHINGRSLLSTKSLAVFENLDDLSSNEIEALVTYLKNPNPHALLLMGSSNGKNVTQLYKSSKKEIVILDLSEEKPWDEKARVQKGVVQTLHQEGKQIDVDAVEKLLEGDRASLDQEIAKLLCFVADRKSITRKDVETICCKSEEEVSFEHAKNLVWEGSKKPPYISDISILLSFIGQLRSQLEIGLKMAAMLSQGKSPDEIATAFPRLFPKALKQCIDGARIKKTDYFRNGLIALFNLEFGIKTSLGKPEVLFSIFCAKLQERKNG